MSFPSLSSSSTDATSTTTNTARPTISTSSSPTTTSAPTTTTTTTTSAPSTITTTVVTTTVATQYSQAALGYFGEIAFSPEFGTSAGGLVKWTEDVRIAVHGDPTEEDIETLHDVVADLGELIDTIQIEVVDTGQNVDLHFAPEAQFASIEPNYVPVNMGFFWVWWDGGRNITEARILVSTTGVTQAERSHLIREEVTQSLGLMMDSSSYPDSIFQQAWTETQQYSDLDEAVIELLYLPQLTPGMTYEEALAAIEG